MRKWISGLGALLLSGLVAPVAAAEYRLAPNGANDMTSAILEAVEKVKGSKKGGTIVLKAGGVYEQGAVQETKFMDKALALGQSI